LATPVRFSFNGFSALSDSYLHRAENLRPFLGTQIVQAVCPSLLPCNSEDSAFLKFGSAIHAVLVSELQLFSREEERVSHLQHIVTTYMVFTRPSIADRASTNALLYLGLMPRAGRCDLDENMAKLLRTLSSSEFSSYLQFVCEALSSNGLALDKTACLIRLISLALHNAPESRCCVPIFFELDSLQKKHRHIKSCTGVCQGVLGYPREQREAFRCSDLTFAYVDVHQRLVFQESMGLSFTSGAVC
jgi:hypothetical protein